MRVYNKLLILCTFFCIHINVTAQVQAQAKAKDYDYSIYDQYLVQDKCKVYDPYEKFNRKMLLINGALDFLILGPVAKIYNRITPDYVQSRLLGVVYNLSEPVSTVNYALQGKGEGVFKSFWRFVLNSTLGIGGMFDVASEFGLSKPTKQSFSSTLAYYGVPPGPYIVLPIFGGMTLRDIPNLKESMITSPIKNAVLVKHFGIDQRFVTGSIMVLKRSASLSSGEHIFNSSIDPYIAYRNAIFNSGESIVEYPKGYRCPK